MLPTCPSTLGDYPNSWGSATQKFSSSFHDKSHAKKKEKMFPSHNPHVQKFHAKKSRPKNIPQPKPIWPKIVHNQKSCTQKGQCPTTKKKKKKKKKKKHTHTHIHNGPIKNFTTIKIFHISIHNYQIFFP